jgi:hypothetical protein
VPLIEHQVCAFPLRAAVRKRLQIAVDPTRQLQRLLRTAPLLKQTLRNNAPPFKVSFPSICPEPVLAKISFLNDDNRARKAKGVFPHRGALASDSAGAVQEHSLVLRDLSVTIQPAWQLRELPDVGPDRSCGNSSFLSPLFLCLSRACLGKMMAFSIQTSRTIKHANLRLRVEAHAQQSQQASE